MDFGAVNAIYSKQTGHIAMSHPCGANEWKHLLILLPTHRQFSKSWKHAELLNNNLLYLGKNNRISTTPIQSITFHYKTCLLKQWSAYDILHVYPHNPTIIHNINTPVFITQWTTLTYQQSKKQSKFHSLADHKFQPVAAYIPILCLPSFHR